MQYVVAFAIIFVLLSALALVLRRLTNARAPSTASVPEGNRNRQPRLGIIDIYELDRQRRLILLRRDNSEHLLLIGGPNDVVVETNIGHAQGVRSGPGAAEAEPDRPEAAGERFPEATAPVRPVIEAPPPPLAAVPQPPAESAPESQAPVEVPVPAAAPVRVEPAAAAPVEPLRRPQRPSQAPPARGVAAGGRANETARPDAARAPAPVPEAGRPRIEPSTRVGRPTDPAVLSDMARQLEEALRRPRPTEADSEAALAIAALPEAAPPMEPIAGPPPAHAAAVPSAPQPGPPEPEAGHAPEPAGPSPEASPLPRPPEPAPAPAAAAPSPPSPAMAPAAVASAGVPSDAVRDPFSVEEIEAEFARLLGRPFGKAERG